MTLEQAKNVKVGDILFSPHFLDYGYSFCVDEIHIRENNVMFQNKNTLYASHENVFLTEKEAALAFYTKAYADNIRKINELEESNKRMIEKIKQYQ